MGEVLEIEEENITLSNELKTHKNIHLNHSYKILELEDGFAKVSINSKKSEQVDDEGIVYDGSIFSAANFCALVAVNIKHIFLISAKVEFLNPVKLEDEDVIFEATASVNSSGKKNISVTGKVNDITIFSGDFVAMKLDSQSIIKPSRPKKRE